MQSVVDILQNMARQRGRADSSPLLWLRVLEARQGVRISHLPISQRLEQAWVTLTGAPFRQHQSLALATLRRGESLALMGGGMAAAQTLHLLMYEMLRGDPNTSALLLLPNAQTADWHQAELERMNAALGRPLSIAQIGMGRIAREAFAARVLLTTPQALHERLLRHHDRAWHLFWSRLRLLLLADAHSYTGVAAAHLANLILRSSRLADPAAPPLLAATLAEVSGADAALQGLSGQSWRIIPVDDVPRPATALAIWQVGNERLREAVALALNFRREGYTVHIACPQLETPLLMQRVGADTQGISVGPTLGPAQVHLFAGYPDTPAALRQAMDSGALLTVLLPGTRPIERALLWRSNAESSPLLDDPPPTWLPPPTNAYVAAQHLLCAATELPLTAAEVNAWQAEQIVARLEQHQHLVRLPDAEIAWQPLPSAGDPYSGFDLQAAGSRSVVLCDERGEVIDTLDPASFDRWGFPGAALPLGRSSFRVADRNDERLSLQLRPEQSARQTFPLRHCSVALRDEREQRVLRGRNIGWGRVMVDEEIYGYRESQANAAPAERALAPTLAARWTAPALWINLPPGAAEGLPQREADSQLAGWTLALALPMLVLCGATDTVPAYDPDLRRIYLIDAQPGGNGLAAWVYARLETLLPLAFDIVIAHRNDPVFEPPVQVDTDWLLALLGGEAAAPQPALPAPLPQQVRGQEPGARSQESGVRSQEPGVRNQEPGTRNQEPGARSQEPGTRSQEPGARSQESGARSQESGARSQEPGVRSQESGARSQESEVRGQELIERGPPPAERGARSGERTAETGGKRQPRERRQPVENRRQAANKRQTANRPQAAGSGPQAASPGSAPQADGKAASRPQAAGNSPPAGRPTPPAAFEPLPDAAAMLARLRRMREQREATTNADAAPSAPPQNHRPVTPRFASGDEIFCLPYGYGTVISSRIEEDRELLNVEFPDYGELAIDPTVSMVRRIEKKGTDADDPPF